MLGLTRAFPNPRKIGWGGLMANQHFIYLNRGQLFIALDIAPNFKFIHLICLRRCPWYACCEISRLNMVKNNWQVEKFLIELMVQNLIDYNIGVFSKTNKVGKNHVEMGIIPNICQKNKHMPSPKLIFFTFIYKWFKGEDCISTKTFLILNGYVGWPNYGTRFPNNINHGIPIYWRTYLFFWASGLYCEINVPHTRAILIHWSANFSSSS